MKVHIKIRDFYSWFRGDLKIEGANSSECSFEILEDGYCTLKFGRDLKCIITFRDYEWCRIFERYLESKNLICQVGVNLWGNRFIHRYGGQEANPRFELTLFAKVNGESPLDNIGVEL